MAKAGLIAGANGIMAEVHHNPAQALSDGKQSLSIPQFIQVFTNLNKLVEIMQKENL